MNPWEDITLDDYENHMKLQTVKQLQMLNEIMKSQCTTFAVSSIMILGVAGGNGLEHIPKDTVKKVYGVDINQAYLTKVKHRYQDLKDILTCLCVDLTKDDSCLPHAELLLANVLIEYIGYRCFQKVVQSVFPSYVSCVIQFNEQDAWVSQSPYEDAFVGLQQVHYQIEEDGVKFAMLEIGYAECYRKEYILPNRKKFIRLDFEKRKEEGKRK